jgi:hypothetical protein
MLVLPALLVRGAAGGVGANGVAATARNAAVDAGAAAAGNSGAAALPALLGIGKARRKHRALEESLRNASPRQGHSNCCANIAKTHRRKWLHNPEFSIRLGIQNLFFSSHAAAP